MIRNIYVDGKIKTMLVLQDDQEGQSSNPIYLALKDQAERIDLLEQQNRSLIHQGEVLLKLLEISTETGNLMANSLNSISDDSFEIDEDALSEELLDQVDGSELGITE